MQWYLLSSREVGTTDDATEIVGYYLKTWTIDDRYRVLKSGFRVEHLLFLHTDRQKRAVGIDAVDRITHNADDYYRTPRARLM